MIAQAGLTLVELLVSLLLGMLVLLTASALLLQTRSAYLFQDETAQIEATGRQALQVIAQAARQAAYVDLEAPCRAACRAAGGTAAVVGLDNARIQGGSGILPVSSTPSVNGSDVLAIRFEGAGEGRHGDGSVVNCAGFGIPANDLGRGDAGYGWSIFYVARDDAGLPQLFCRYRSDKAWATQALVSGVDALQVLYGVDLDGDGLADRIVNASEIRRMNAGAGHAGKDTARTGPAAGAGDGFWSRVVLLRIALLVSGAPGGRAAVRPLRTHALFGPEYADEAGGNDPGVWLDEADLPVTERYRMRKIFAMSLPLPLRHDGGGQ